MGNSMDVLNWIIGIHIALFLACWGYAELLDRIHEIYTPDYVWLTVVGGVALIILAFAAVAATGLIPWQAVLIATTLASTAGIPIIRWQRQQAKQRAAERARDKERRRT